MRPPAWRSLDPTAELQRTTALYVLVFMLGVANGPSMILKLYPAVR